MIESAYPTPASPGAVAAAPDRIDSAATALAGFLATYPGLVVLSGAGCSTESGIPDYRDTDGAWKRRPPVTWALFSQNLPARRRYWARNLLGWPRIALARPNAAHRALAQLETQGRLKTLITQNVDGLHQAAGSERVIDLHGRMDRIVCVACGDHQHRADFQAHLASLNPAWTGRSARTAPDGDADIDVASDEAFDHFSVPDCERCGGLLKPDVVFFGENVPAARVEQAYAALAEAEALLVLGSSLMVYSGYRFALSAAKAGLPIAAVNLGRTRADALLQLKLEQPVGALLSAALERL